MEIASKALLFIHIFFGTISLVVFWLPAVFTKKGGQWHNKLGKIYVYLMTGVVISAALLCIKNVIIGNYNSAIFLGFLTLITAQPIWYGTAVLKYKKGLSKSFWLLHISFRLLIIIAALSLICYGSYLYINHEVHPLLFIFGFLGATDLPAWIKEIRNPPSKVNWLEDHFSSMIVSGIAAYTAFFAFGGRAMMSEVLVGYWQIVPWVLPTIIGVIAIKILKAKYQKRKSNTSRVSLSNISSPVSAPPTV